MILAGAAGAEQLQELLTQQSVQFNKVARMQRVPAGITKPAGTVIVMK